MNALTQNFQNTHTHTLTHNFDYKTQDTVQTYNKKTHDHKNTFHFPVKNKLYTIMYQPMAWTITDCWHIKQKMKKKKEKHTHMQQTPKENPHSNFS